MPPIASRRSSTIEYLLPHQLAVACTVATFWRGTWYIMDALCPADPLTSGIVCLSAGFASFALGQSVVGPLLTSSFPTGPMAPIARLASLYWIAVSCVSTWRGVWCLVDALSENVAGSTVQEHLLHSGLASHVGAVALLVVIGRATAILSSPAKPGLLNDNRLWDSAPTEIQWLDWTFMGPPAAAAALAQPEAEPQPSSAREPPADAGAPAPSSRWSRIRVRRIRRMYSSDDS
jgi:hypothetical protein